MLLSEARDILLEERHKMILEKNWSFLGDALSYGAEALKAQAVRDQGCEYCREGKPLSEGTSACSWVEDDKLYWHTDEYGKEELASLNYCFKCGRELGGDERE